MRKSPVVCVLLVALALMTTSCTDSKDARSPYDAATTTTLSSTPVDAKAAESDAFVIARLSDYLPADWNADDSDVRKSENGASLCALKTPTVTDVFSETYVRSFGETVRTQVSFLRSANQRDGDRQEMLALVECIRAHMGEVFQQDETWAGDEGLAPYTTVPVSTSSTLSSIPGLILDANTFGWRITSLVSRQGDHPKTGVEFLDVFGFYEGAARTMLYVNSEASAPSIDFENHLLQEVRAKARKTTT